MRLVSFIPFGMLYKQQHVSCHCACTSWRNIDGF